ncbi:MAG: VTT domain-containing protein [Longimicrobiales bacterium]|nr:VTT domain-containing protein [Longimicrobiales bacterium]
MDLFFANMEVWLADLGGLAYVVAPIVMVGVSFLPLPAEAPALANGMLFGPVVGSMITWSGAMAGAWISYEIAGRWGRPIARRFTSEEVVDRIDRGAEKAGWWGLLVLRFVPVVAFTALNWGAGLCGVPRWRFLWTTALGIAPGAILFTSSGVGLGALWRRSPALAGGLLILLIIGSAIWALRKQKPAAT